MDIRDTDAETVNRLLQWLYCREFQVPDGNTLDDYEAFYLSLARLSTLADKYDISALADDIHDKILDSYSNGSRKPPQQSVVVYTYANSSSLSIFRKFLVAWYAYHIDSDWYDFPDTKIFLSEQPEFSIDLAIELGRHKPCPALTKCHLHMTKASLHQSK